MSIDKIGLALKAVALLVDLTKRAIEAIGKGDYQRVEQIIPAQLRISVERSIAEDEARERYKPK